MTDTAHYTTRRKGFIAGHIRHLGRPASRLVAQVESRRGPITVQDHVQDQLCVALVVHKAQGMTCDEALLLGSESLFAEAGYTGLSRGRAHNHLYAVASSDELGPTGVDDPLAHVRRTLQVSHAKTAAMDLVAQVGP